MMRDDYRYLYARPAAPPQRAAIAYIDPVLTETERRQRASKLAKQEAALRRAKLAERWIVFTVAGVIAITMLPVVVIIAAIAAAVSIWRRATRWLRSRDARAGTEANAPRESSGDRIALRQRAHSRIRPERQPLSYATDADVAPEFANAWVKGVQT
jgi:hypothetical protein